MKRFNHVGVRYGRLLVLKNVPELRKSHQRLLCSCDCGNEIEVESKHLVSGRIQSCGCLKKEMSKNRAISGAGVVKTTHGLSESPEYKIWTGIKVRCRKSKHYADRGIAMCDRWDKSFSAFLQDMGNRPSEFHSIERIDNNGNYEPSNCKWATAIEQANNKRSSRLITHNGETKTLSEWARQAGLKMPSLWARLNYGMDFETAITRPLRITRRHQRPL